jgi:exodeoxyribonuclease V
MIVLSQDQQLALDKLLAWHKSKDKSRYITLGGYAGTGKTTLISILRKRIFELDSKTKVAFVSFTGKAARVLDSKLKESSSMYPKDSVSTIHSLIYSPIIGPKKDIIGWELRDGLKCNLIIVDEASMVDERIWKDLLSFQIPIIAVGDHGQLPPINGNFNLMQKPEILLEEIHRQARDNPIIKLSIMARQKGYIPIGVYADTVIKYDKKNPDSMENVSDLLTSFDSDTLVLCGYNYTRIKLNRHIRQALGFDSDFPTKRDKVVCLRNNYQTKVTNGIVGKIDFIEDENDDWYFAKIDFEDQASHFEGLISKEQFNSPSPLNFTQKRKNTLKGDLFDFGYALTVHKAQGSQARRVILFEERFKQMDDNAWRRWLYTAVTRAEESLVIIGS